MKKIISFLVILILTSSAQGQSVESIFFQDLDNDGDPDLAVIEADFHTDHDRVLVYDQDGDMIESQNWKICCDFDSDVWVFDAESDGKASLIINFFKINGKLVAELYDDQDEDNEVSYSAVGKYVNITESPSWTLQVIAEDGFWVENEKINYNIQIFADGSINFLNIDPKDKDKIIHDGNVDFEIKIFDIDRDFDPDFEFRNLFPTEIKVGNLLNVDQDDREAGIKDYLFWPYLGSGRHSWNRHYNEALAPIRISWDNAKITDITEIVPSRGGEGNYFVFIPLYKDKVNYHFGENPFAYYDLARDSDGYPELIVRTVEGAFYDNETTTDRYYGNVRYTWDQDNNDQSDYSIGLIGRNYYNSTVTYPWFSVSQVPYEEVPNWIFNHSWAAVTFTVDEDNDEGLGEGIYENFIFRGLMEQKILKAERAEFLPEFIPIPMKLGDREEYAFNMDEVPHIYFSPVDNRIHLSSADRGIWIISAKKRLDRYGFSDFTKDELRTGNVRTIEKIEYQNIDKDYYIDKWTYYVNDTPYRHLIYNNGFLIYSDQEVIKLLKTEINQSLFETVPPRNHEEWKELGHKLNIYEKYLDGRDFKTMFNQFRGDLIEVKGGSLTGFNLTSRGFKVILNCSSSCSISPDSKIKYEKPLQEGIYVLEYDGAFSLKEPYEKISMLDKLTISANSKTIIFAALILLGMLGLAMYITRLILHL